jgi:D-alanyl-D-alanine carboxypeptidase
MNEKVKFIGLKNSEFSNPQGFDNPHNYSTVEDLAVISNYAVTHYPLLAQIVKKDHEVLSANEYHQEYYLNNWNGLLDVYPNVMGVKIGNTNEAGTTTAVVSERNGKRIVVVLLGAPDILNRDLWASELLDVGFEKTAGLAAISVTENQLRDKYSTWKYFN